MVELQSITSATNVFEDFYGSSFERAIFIHLKGSFHYEGTLLTCPGHINNRKYLST